MCSFSNGPVQRRLIWPVVVPQSGHPGHCSVDEHALVVVPSSPHPGDKKQEKNNMYFSRLKASGYNPKMCGRKKRKTFHCDHFSNGPVQRRLIWSDRRTSKWPPRRLQRRRACPGRRTFKRAPRPPTKTHKQNMYFSGVKAFE